MKWPSLVGETDAVLPLSGEDEWPEESELKRRFGYSVRKGISITDRRACLKKAVEKHDGLTAHGVAEQIARLIKINQHRHDTRMDDAIDRWRADFNWFQVEFGKNASSWPHI